MPPTPLRTLYRHGRVRSPVDPLATALLVEDGLVAWVGRESDAEALSPDVTLDLGEAWVAPAFVDAHVHTTATGLALSGLDLTGCACLADALRHVEEQTRRSRGGVVLGTGWDETDWPEGRPPTATELDRASYGGVVYLARADVHSAVASSALLAACPEARVLPGFLPDGLVQQEAHHAVRRAAYASVTVAQRRAAQHAALDQAAARGIACIHECGGPEIAGEQDLLDLLALEHPVERLAYWGELGGAARARELGAVGAAGDLFVDGALGSRTAWLHEPYADASGTGRRYLDAGRVASHVAECTREGLQAGFHAIGDAAVAAVVAGFESAARELGDQALRSARHRVEHLELVTTDQLELLGSLGVTASVQPAFDARWGGPEGMYALRLGARRAVAMNPFAAMAAARVPLALGSDSPVTPLDPWGTLRAAVQHRTPGSGLSAPAAFAAHTRGGWRAARRDREGDLVPGAPATFAVWQVEGEHPAPDAVSGDSGLPDLGGPDPVCLRTVVGGAAAFVGG